MQRTEYRHRGSISSSYQTYDQEQTCSESSGKFPFLHNREVSKNMMNVMYATWRFQRQSLPTKQVSHSVVITNQSFEIVLRHTWGIFQPKHYLNFQSKNPTPELERIRFSKQRPKCGSIIKINEDNQKTMIFMDTASYEWLPFVKNVLRLNVTHSSPRS